MIPIGGIKPINLDDNLDEQCMDKAKELLKEEKEFLTNEEYESALEEEYNKLKEDENYLIKIGKGNHSYTFLNNEFLSFEVDFYSDDVEIFTLGGGYSSKMTTKNGLILNLKMKPNNKIDNFIRFIEDNKSLVDIHLKHFRDINVDRTFKGNVSLEKSCNDYIYQDILELTIKEV